METPRPKVGVAAIIIKDNKILLGKRKNAHGDGTWSFPGGHLEWMETLESCAMREIKEETSLTVTNMRLFTITNDFFVKENKHYITVFMLADWKEGQAQIMEPEKSEKWNWFSWNQLPSPLFIPIQNLLKQHPKQPW